MKRILVLLAVGGLFGMVGGSWLGPKFIAWWSNPPVQNNMLSCTKEIAWAMDSLVETQLGFAAAMAVVTAIVGSIVARAWRNRAALKASKAQAAVAATKPQA